MRNFVEKLERPVSRMSRMYTVDAGELTAFTDVISVTEIAFVLRGEAKHKYDCFVNLRSCEVKSPGKN